MPQPLQLLPPVAAILLPGLLMLVLVFPGAAKLSSNSKSGTAPVAEVEGADATVGGALERELSARRSQRSSSCCDDFALASCEARAG